MKNRNWLIIFVFIIFFFARANLADAHRSGCHRWHSCPSDSGSYTCGDAGHPCQYPTYPASGGVIYPPSGYYKDCYDCALKKVPSNAYTSGITFECNSGYTKISDSCLKINTNSSPSSNYPPPSSKCPLNSSTSLTDSTKCSCNSGYATNSTKTTCELIPSAELNNKSCRDKYGINSNWNGTMTSEGLLNCGCVSGYAWNQSYTACILPTTTYTSSNTADLERSNLIAAIIAQIAALQAQIDKMRSGI